jgi:hypothetical protein
VSSTATSTLAPVLVALTGDIFFSGAQFSPLVALPPTREVALLSVLTVEAIGISLLLLGDDEGPSTDTVEVFF